MIEFLPSEGDLEVVVLAAHPDDAEIACGGTLLQLGRRPGTTAHRLTLTGSPEREQEALAAAEAFLPGSVSHFTRLPDGYLPAHWSEAKSAVQDLARAVPSPALVFAPRPDDSHQDHRLLGRLASTAWRNSLILHYEIPKWDGDLKPQNTYVPVPDEVAREKCTLLTASYPSQKDRDWWDDEMFLGLMRLRGVECRSRYAESFLVNKWRLCLDAAAATNQE